MYLYTYTTYLVIVNGVTSQSRLCYVANYRLMLERESAELWLRSATAVLTLPLLWSGEDWIAVADRGW
jgi:hypothetical protein